MDSRDNFNISLLPSYCLFHRVLPLPYGSLSSSERAFPLSPLPPLSPRKANFAPPRPRSSFCPHILTRTVSPSLGVDSKLTHHLPPPLFSSFPVPLGTYLGGAPCFLCQFGLIWCVHTLNTPFRPHFLLAASFTPQTVWFLGISALASPPYHLSDHCAWLLALRSDFFFQTGPGKVLLAEGLDGAEGL